MSVAVAGDEPLSVFDCVADDEPVNVGDSEPLSVGWVVADPVEAVALALLLTE